MGQVSQERRANSFTHSPNALPLLLREQTLGEERECPDWIIRTKVGVEQKTTKQPKMAKELKNLTKRSEDYSRWYNELVQGNGCAECLLPLAHPEELPFKGG